MRQREIERIEKMIVEICWANYGSQGDIGASVIHPARDAPCPYNENGKCVMYGRVQIRKCNVVKFRLVREAA